MSDDELVERAQTRIGEVLCGKYRLEALLGIGGMGAVYSATHVRNSNHVAIKMLHRELAVEETLRKRFLREGYVANNVNHPGTVRVLDDDITEDGSTFLVMQLLEDGETLDAILAHGNVDIAQVVSLSIKLLDVLESAHAKQIVHRDIKPENLYLTTSGRLKVLDFGVASMREASQNSPRATRSGSVFGTPAFMPPEQALGRTASIDALSDIWAVGATMFSLLSGCLVHEDGTPEEMLVYAATKPARSLASVASWVPLPLVDVVTKALAFDKKNRWQSAKEMREALETIESEIGDEGEPTSVYLATVRAEMAEQAKTRFAAVPKMTMRGLGTPDLRLRASTVAMPTLVATAITKRPARPTRRVKVLLAVAAAAAGLLLPMVLGLAFSALHSVGSADSTGALVVALPSASVDVSPSVSEPVPEATEEPLRSASAAPSDTASPDPPAPAPPPPHAARPVPMRPPVAMPPPVAPADKPNCKPPFVIDSNGKKKWKRECI